MGRRQSALESLGVSNFWRGKKVLVTGHTGFKGSWLSLWLAQMGADPFGYALEPDTTPSLFVQLGLERRIDHLIADIRDGDAVRKRVDLIKPDVVFHLAAQPLVRHSYREPLRTWNVNVMGTAHLLDGLRGLDKTCAVVVVTTDKVYENREWIHPYRETDRLGGYDPYSASKAAAELVASSYRQSFFGADAPVRIATARAGNVIGGGDWAEDRIVPDMIRALALGAEVAVRNPDAVRPWQHVLEPLSGYLRLAQNLYEKNDELLQSCFNFGPHAGDSRTVRQLVEGALAHWPGVWQDVSDPTAVHEAGLLNLDISKAQALLGWEPRWDFNASIRETIEWHRAVHGGQSPLDATLAQIRMFGAP